MAIGKVRLGQEGICHLETQAARGAVLAGLGGFALAEGATAG